MINFFRQFTNFWIFSLAGKLFKFFFHKIGKRSDFIII